MSFRGTIGVDLVAVVLVRQSMMSMPFAKHMMSAIEEIEIDMPVIRSFRDAYDRKLIHIPKRDDMQARCIIL